MTQLLLIKNANTEMKEVGHVVDIFNGTHIFAESDEREYTIMKVEGYTKEELIEYLQQNVDCERNLASRLPVANEWVLGESEETEVWKDSANKWKFHTSKNKFQYTIKNMTTLQKTTLTSKISSSQDKNTALQGIESVLELEPSNQVEVTELNK